MSDIDFPPWDIPPDPPVAMTLLEYTEWVEAYCRSLSPEENARLRHRPMPTGPRFHLDDDEA